MPTIRRAFTRLSSACPGVQLASIALFAALLALPYLVNGVSSGYDASTHVEYQHHFSDQFWAGEVYPRWLAGANKGYGSPTFLIQYPLPYFVTALLRPLTQFPRGPDREARELGVFSAVVVASAGIAAWYWTRHFVSASAATLAALLYLSLPHLLLCLYVNASIGELSALVFMPLSLGLCEAMHRKGAVIFLLSASLALLFLSNILVAVLFLPAFVFYGLLSARHLGIPLSRTAARLACSICLGAGIASVYLVPLLMYRPLFNPGAMAATLQDFQLGHYFLYITSGSLRGARMLLSTAGTVALLVLSGWAIWSIRDQRLVSAAMALIVIFCTLTLLPNAGLAVVRFTGFVVSDSPLWETLASQLALTSISTMILGLLAIVSLGNHRGARQSALMLIAGVAFTMMLPFSAPVWKAFPAIQTVQFPIRFGGILIVAVAGLVASVLDVVLSRGERKRNRVLWEYGMAVPSVILIGIVAFRVDDLFRQPREAINYNVHRDIDVNYRMYVPPAHLGAFAEAMGSRPEIYRALPTPEDGTLRVNILEGDNCVRVVRNGPRTLSVAAECKAPVRLRIGQLNFPLWRAIPLTGPSDGSVLETSRAGLMELRLASGSQRLELEFDATRGERWGFVGSAASLLVSTIGYIVFRRKSTRGSVQGVLHGS